VGIFSRLTASVHSCAQAPEGRARQAWLRDQLRIAQPKALDYDQGS
jgi:hypothetical protein